MCGPFCSVPAVPMITVVQPALDEVARLGPGELLEEHRVGRRAAGAGGRGSRPGAGPRRSIPPAARRHGERQHTESHARAPRATKPTPGRASTLSRNVSGRRRLRTARAGAEAESRAISAPAPPAAAWHASCSCPGTDRRPPSPKASARRAIAAGDRSAGGRHGTTACTARQRSPADARVLLPRLEGRLRGRRQPAGAALQRQRARALRADVHRHGHRVPDAGQPRVGVRHLRPRRRPGRSTPACSRPPARTACSWPASSRTRRAPATTCGGTPTSARRSSSAPPAPRRSRAKALLLDTMGRQFEPWRAALLAAQPRTARPAVPAERAGAAAGDVVAPRRSRGTIIGTRCR